MNCTYAHFDGCYVLGALSPTERHEFAEHLGDCDSCARSVSAVAGLPGLLARLSPSEVDVPQAPEPVPDTLLPALLKQVRRRGRRRTTVTAALAAAAAAAVAVGSPTLTTLVGGQETPTVAPTVTVGPPVTPAAPGRPMLPLGAVPVRATVTFHSVPWGTHLVMTCSHAPPRGVYATSEPETYALVVHTRDGHAQQVATWRSLPDRTMRLTAATAASRSQITSVEVHTAEGRPVLRLRT